MFPISLQQSSSSNDCALHLLKNFKIYLDIQNNSPSTPDDPPEERYSGYSSQEVTSLREKIYLLVKKRTNSPWLIIDIDFEYEVEGIWGMRKTKNQTKYLVKWAGFDESHNSFVPADDISTNALLKYHFDNKVPMDDALKLRVEKNRQIFE